MGEQTQQDQTYVVQREVVWGHPVPVGSTGGEPVYDQRVSWEDVATVTVPARTLRKTVVLKALTDAGIAPAVGEEMRVRVLDVDSARVLPVGAVQPPPQLTIGESA